MITILCYLVYMSYKTTPTGTDDIIDVRDLIEYFKDLRGECENIDADTEDTDELDQLEELKKFQELMDELSGNGGDEQFEGDWYPLTLINERHFEDYARELAEDTGAVDTNATWPMNCIDWKEAAEQLRQDYTSCEFEGTTFYYR